MPDENLNNRAQSTALIWDRAQFIELAGKLGVRDNWHEPDEQEVTVTVTGHTFDNAGFPSGSVPAYPEIEELTVTFIRNGEPVARILLATLCAFATGWEGLRSA
jgi:hypothetical protein